jgi:hypothetical protein
MPFTAWRYVCVVYFMVLTLTSFGQQPEPDSIAQAPDRYLLIPVVMRSPVTRWSAGLASSYLYRYSKKDTVTRTSNLEFLGLKTQNRQTVLVLGANVYTREEKYILRWRNSFSHFPDKFWGLGNSTPASNKEPYLYSQFLINPQLMRKISYKFYTGIFYELQRVYNMSYQQGGLFDQDKIVGRGSSTVSGLGLILAWDSRNNAFSSSKGLFAQLSVVNFNRVIRSDYNFVTYIADVRKFIPLFKKHALGFQFYGYFNRGSSPIRNLAMLGGSDIMRGYYAGRYRDNDLMAGQIEYRLPLFWRIGIVGFAGLGRVADKIQDFSYRGLKYSVGSGLRIALKPKEKLNLRIDYGFGNNTQGLYVTVGESF